MTKRTILFFRSPDTLSGGRKLSSGRTGLFALADGRHSPDRHTPTAQHNFALNQTLQPNKMQHSGGVHKVTGDRNLMGKRAIKFPILNDPTGIMGAVASRARCSTEE
jgi:hypothetical protein